MIEDSILSNLIYNEPFCRKAIPFLKSDYFQEGGQKVAFDIIDNYIALYNNLPSKEALLVELENVNGINEHQYKSAQDIIGNLKADESKFDWLMDVTEKFCQDKAVYNAIMESIHIMDDKTGKFSKGIIPKLLSDALAVSFDQSIGHDFFMDTAARYDFYHTVEERVPFDLDFFNEITKGGLPKKTLNIILAGTGVGKSLFMCHCAASNVLAGKNVLYITMEMAEERIAERIDANLMNVPISELSILPKDVYQKKMDRVMDKAVGKLIIKEYPTAGASAQHFRNLLNELALKKNFKPDIIYIDYLNICMSSRIKQGTNVNSYSYIKSIAEELRGLAVEFKVPIVSATQTTRAGFTSSDLGLEDTSESFGLPATADFMFALIATEELDEIGQIMVKQLKNRYTDVGSSRRAVIGVDKSKMKLFNVEQSAQDNILDDDAPIFEKTGSGRKIIDRESKKRKFNGPPNGELHF